MLFCLTKLYFSLKTNPYLYCRKLTRFNPPHNLTTPKNYSHPLAPPPKPIKRTRLYQNRLKISKFFKLTPFGGRHVDGGSDRTRRTKSGEIEARGFWLYFWPFWPFLAVLAFLAEESERGFL